MVTPQDKLPDGIVRSLGIQGWQHLDPIILAALATRAPLLLVGPHGTAKTLLVERIAAAMQVSLQHYNASLINYDDLVGIPLPDESGQRLKFISTPGSIWDTEFAFFDEISRCRPDLQNKMFPIIHERRVSGIRLERLKHRWGAMNPPSPDDIEGSAGHYYLGSEPLDPALADRFPFIVFVPTWSELSPADRRQIIRWREGDPFSEFDRQRILGDHPLPGLVARCETYIPSLETQLADWLSDYVLYVFDLLAKAGLPQSPRRARMLARSIVAVHAAQMVLEGEDAELEYSAHITLTYSLPENASEVPPAASNVLAAHKQAWEIAALPAEDPMRQVLIEVDPLQRVLLAEQLDLDQETVSRLITQALGSASSEARRMGLATAIFLSVYVQRSLTSAAWEPLARYARQIIEPQSKTTTVQQGQTQNIWLAIMNWLEGFGSDPPDFRQRLERNFVMSGFPDLWIKMNWQDALKQFQEDLDFFNVQEVTT